jgi:hypothetical protein
MFFSTGLESGNHGFTSNSKLSGTTHSLVTSEGELGTIVIKLCFLKAFLLWDILCFLAYRAHKHSSMASLYASIAEFPSIRTVVLTSLLLLLAVVVVAHFSTLHYPAEIPRVREREGKRYFGLRTRLAYYTDAKELVREAYEKLRSEIQSL